LYLFIHVFLPLKISTSESLSVCLSVCPRLFDESSFGVFSVTIVNVEVQADEEDDSDEEGDEGEEDELLEQAGLLEVDGELVLLFRQLVAFTFQ